LAGGIVQAGFQAAIFDVDGVLVDSPHERAWRGALAELMERDWRSLRLRTTYSPERFSPQLYHAEMSGKPTISGARAALEYFGVPDVEDRIEQHGERKQQIVDEILAAEGLAPYWDGLRFVLAVREAGILVGAASSSKNAGRLLRDIRLDGFAEQKDSPPGLLRLELSLDPEIFVTAARELGVSPSAWFVVEDAVSGIQAAKAAEMAGGGTGAGRRRRDPRGRTGRPGHKEPGRGGSLRAWRGSPGKQGDMYGKAATVAADGLAPRAQHDGLMQSQGECVRPAGLGCAGADVIAAGKDGLWMRDISPGERAT
jgi:HAD superfamily hydrolase (TIGR01509 family)